MINDVKVAHDIFGRIKVINVFDSVESLTHGNCAPTIQSTGL